MSANIRQHKLILSNFQFWRNSSAKQIFFLYKMEGKSKTLMLMAAFKINQKAKNICKNKKLKIMPQVARIDISKRKNFLASISKSNLFALYNGKKERSTWNFNREENWFENIWKRRQSNEFQSRWSQDFCINGVNFEKLGCSFLTKFKKTRHKFAENNTSRKTCWCCTLTFSDRKLFSECCQNVCYLQINCSENNTRFLRYNYLDIFKFHKTSPKSDRKNYSNGVI